MNGWLGTVARPCGSLKTTVVTLSALAIVLAFFCAGCGEPTITSYRVPKEKKTPVETPPTADAGPKWKVPPQWTALPAGQMQLAKFAMPQRGNAKAEVAVSVFSSDTGGTLRNVNRWRGQIGLGPVTEAELAQQVTKLDPANPQAVLVDLKNNDLQLIAAIIPRGGQWFFYKLTGDAAAVAPERDAFVAFVKSEP
jgi:hypothetical protein